MRLRLAFAAVAAALLPAVAHAAVPVCKGIALVSPSEGAHFIGSRPIHFSWSGEPVGTANRDLHLAALDGSETVIPLDGRFSDTVRVKMTGDLGWAVVFKDANGKPLCVSPAGLLKSGPGGGSATGSMASLSGPSSGATAPSVPPRLVVGFTNSGRLVIVLQNTPYTGQYSKLVAADDYDMTGEDLMGTTGVEFHGNNVRNVVTGSIGNDLIFLYDGNDEADGGPGDDILVGGLGNDILRDPAKGDSDQLYGGPGRDAIDVDDDDPLDIADWGTSPENAEGIFLDDLDEMATAGTSDGPTP